MKELSTWAGRSSFKYEGSVGLGTRIFFGADYSNQMFMSSQDYQKLIAQFSGKSVQIGTSRDNPPEDSLGKWLQENVTKVAIASYIGAILIHEGYAEREDKTTIKF